MYTVLLRPVLLLFYACWCISLHAQGYFKELQQPERLYERKLLRLSNGDIITGDASLKGLTLENERGIYLTKFDKCGHEIWTKRYSWKQNVIEFKDFVRDEADNIILLGRAYETPNEFTFLLKINKDGKPVQFRFFHGGTVDQFTFDLDRRSGHLLINGLLLNWMVLKEGFVAVLDENFNQVWGTKITPFESDGSAILVENGAVVCRTGPYLAQINQQGNIDWSVHIENAPGAFPVFGPLATGDGYLFELHRHGYSFFYKTDKTGQLLWQSDRFPSTQYSADVVPLEDGRFFVAYCQPGNGETFLCRMVLSAEGEILSQHRLSVSQDFTTGVIDADLLDNKTMNIVANGDLYIGNITNNTSFLMQFPIDSLHDRCFNWEPFDDIQPIDSLLVMVPTPMENPLLTLTKQDPNISVVNAEIVVSDICDVRPATEVVQDSMLTCDATWTVTLDDPSMQWADQFPGLTRVLRVPGTYLASNSDCIFPVNYTFNLTREPCPCPVYLPNAFSPDNDGVDDHLALFSQCALETAHLQVFNRWGQKVFETSEPDGFWNGKSGEQPLPPGVYMALATYSWTDESGKTQQKTIFSDVTLVR